MYNRGGKQNRKDEGALTLQSKFPMPLFDSFDVVHTAGTTSDVGGISASSSEDSDMAHYSRRRRKKEPEKRALHFAGFGLFNQCVVSHGDSDADIVFKDIVKMTKDILLPVLAHADCDGYSRQQKEVETVEEENVEIGEEEILRHDYDLERV